MFAEIHIVFCRIVAAIVATAALQVAPAPSAQSPAHSPRCCMLPLDACYPGPVALPESSAIDSRLPRAVRRRAQSYVAPHELLCLKPQRFFVALAAACAFGSLRAGRRPTLLACAPRPYRVLRVLQIPAPPAGNYSPADCLRALPCKRPRPQHRGPATMLARSSRFARRPSHNGPPDGSESDSRVISSLYSLQVW